MANRRKFLELASGIVAAGSGLLLPRSLLARTTSLGPSTLPAGDLESSLVTTLPGKAPLIKRSFRPPNYETPLAALDDMFTPNERFFVRWHLSSIPEIDATAWRLRIVGPSAGKPLELSLSDLRKFAHAEVAAVNMCAGNRRGLSQPHVAGVEWAHGAIGNARWKGARLKDVLARAGLKKDAVEVAFQGQDRGPIAGTPQFAKSLPVQKALHPDTLLAWEMNGQPLPPHNGFPVRLIVPGWAGTYWMKQITEIQLLPQAFDNFWMKSAYRIPIGKFPHLPRFASQDSPNVPTTPITELVVNSLITSLDDGQQLARGQSVQVRGVAWDGGHGIAKAELSTDGGSSWQAAQLERDAGNFSWRRFSFAFRPEQAGQVVVSVRATGKQGETQSPTLIWNPAGYHNNVPHQVTVQVV
jgi:DMSO/TMAO reductase YedYZ molybdopterin-dependent catalytic subunit